MVKFTVDEIRALMDKPHNIRNMSVIAHGACRPWQIDAYRLARLESRHHRQDRRAVVKDIAIWQDLQID
ncbi:unnamed protein product [Mycena citricolor]|uniref:Uncharacterized protein n=1 Tax=Mycena citricolor TaxID=2018698 RepID=A0AAD2HYL2_9AGAR|nr:unnamed protein product [Mycena citricolor]